ncbi:FkbM family methyltransferase [Phyllobacterium sp. 21LDTY02-6]|nr:FkbM family methyltransferase [Phyllobacterium sp. 21LDTY02-6]MCO4318079.1 FkbM family methyltransferase [Phyllobacterium sp. 21LDTY02-6]MCX8280073.1 FkbM family methyltransferase [Phyllobacterium sp. 0TCS1.6C]MCX8294365.1 FkbM family methyltransferase [Phyllobacterium sp. 0TCS1.6A]
MKNTLHLHGIDVPIMPDEVSDIIWSALRDGSYEAKEARWAVKAARPKDRILELGSGIGVITSLLAAVDGTQVMAFEANPHTVTLAEKVIRANNRNNVELRQGLLTAGPPQDFTFYVREDLWMSSLLEHQGPYLKTIKIQSTNIDEFIRQANIDLIVMDIEGAELDLLKGAELPGVERVFLEFHDHLYGLEGIRHLTSAMADKGFAYDPRGSSGPCVLFSRNTDPRSYEAEDIHAAA